MGLLLGRFELLNVLTLLCRLGYLACSWARGGLEPAEGVVFGTSKVEQITTEAELGSRFQRLLRSLFERLLDIRGWLRVDLVGAQTQICQVLVLNDPACLERVKLHFWLLVELVLVELLGSLIVLFLRHEFAAGDDRWFVGVNFVPFDR